MTNSAKEFTESLDPFYREFKGSFTSYMRWSDLNALWMHLKQEQDKQWYIYAIGEAVPKQPLNHEQLCKFIDEMDTLLHKDHKEDYCGIVYANSKTQPTFIKIFDPNNLGVSCGFSDNPPLPGWILTILPPKPLEDKSVLSQQRKKWWQRIWNN